MAKQVSEILIKLGLQGVEGLDKLKGAFRELEKSIGPNNAAIERARQSIIDYGRDSRNTEQVIKGQIDALRGLQSQVERGSSTWAQLATDIERFRQASRRTDSELETLRQGILAISSGTNQSQASLRGYIIDLGKLRTEASLTGSTFTALGQDIAELTGRLQQAEAQTVQTSRAFGRVLGQALASTSAGARRQLQDLQSLIAEQRQAIDTIDTLSQRERRLTSNVEARANAQDRLNRALAQQRQLTYQESIRAGRETVRAGAAAFADPTFLTPEGVNRRFGELPNTTAALSQELNELSERLANTVRESTDYVNVSNRIADVQRELRRELTGTADAFERLARAQSATERRGQKIADIQEYYSTQGPLAPGVGGYRDPVTGAMIARGANTPGRIRVDEAAYAQPIGPQAFPEAGRRAQESIQSALDDVNRIYESAKIQRAEIQTKYDDIYTDKLLQGLDLEGQIREKAFRDELTAFDRQLEARDRKRRGRLTAGQAVQAAGAAISGGIFGGPEGLLGGIGGAAIGSAIPGLGTVGGAFAGAAVGAQVGMFRQQIAGTADYAAQIGKLQIALRGIVGSQQEYETALRVAADATRELNIPQEEAIGGLTRLTAAVRGAGGTVMDSSFAFRAISEAVKATGGSAQQADGAVLALTQVFSKGKVSAEELNQIAERLPGTFTLFAQAAGKTGPELQKALEQGQVGLNDLMKFLAILRDRYSGTARDIAKSSEDAGARLRVAFDGMRLSVGKVLQPLGAEFQNAFANFITNITPALTAAANAVASAISNMYRIIASGFGLLGQLRDLIVNVTKVLIVFGGVSAGVFVANNIATFTSAIKGVLVVLRTMLSIEKALLVIESARLATQTLIAGLSAGATKGRIVGAVLGGAAGIGAVVGIGEIIKKIVKDIETGISGGLGNVKLDVSQLTTNFPTAPDDKTAKELAKQQKKDADEALRKQTSINRLLQEQLRLNYEAGVIGKDSLSKLDAEQQLLKQIIRYRINEVNLTSKTEDERQLGLSNLSLEFKKENDRIKQQRADILEEVKGLGKDIKKDWSQLSGELVTESPLDTIIRKFEEDRAAFIERRRQELKTLGEKVGLGPEGAGKRAQLGGALSAAEDITSAQVNTIATKQLLQGDVNALLSDIQTLRTGGNTMGTLGEIMQKHSEYWLKLDEGQRQYIANLAEIKDSLLFMQDFRIGAGFEEGVQAYVESIGTMREATAQLAQTGIKGVEEAIFSLVTTGTANFREFAVNILKDTARMIIQQLVLRTIMQAIGFLGGGGSSLAKTFEMPKFAKGGTFANGIVPFAMGGVVNKPTLFKFANGGAGQLGLMGEAGPEAIMPLRRGRDGRLGVAAGGGGGNTSVVVNVDASGGSQVQGSPGQAEALGRAVSQAVQNELLRQKRPGGLLAA